MPSIVDPFNLLRSRLQDTLKNVTRSKPPTPAQRQRLVMLISLCSKFTLYAEGSPYTLDL
ncbi:hypothetical protein WG66_012023 [Moniliophthora roreri]|nr:hypothetical protein WG66_012023 [Moniliophthora roreri]